MTAQGIKSGERGLFLSVCRWILVPRRRRTFIVVAVVLLGGTAWLGGRDFCLWRASACVALRQDPAAEAWLRRARWFGLPTARRYLLRSKLARRSGRFAEVAPHLESARRLGASVEELERENLLALIQTQQFESVSAANWKTLISDPRDDEPEIGKGYVIWANSRFQFDDAARMLRVWEQDFPLDPDPHQLRGQLFVGMSNWEAAEASYRQALKLGPGRPDILMGLADSLKHQFKLDEAIPTYRAVLQNEPDNQACLVGLSQSLVTHGDVPEARQLLEESVRRHPENVDLQQALGEVLLAGGDAAAVGPLQKVHAARPENADLAYSLARAYQASGQAEPAKPLFAFVEESRGPLASLKKLVDHMVQHPNDVETRYQIAAITAKYKSRAEAIRWYLNLLIIDPQHIPTHRALADLYRLAGNQPRAEYHEQLVNGTAAGN